MKQNHKKRTMIELFEFFFFTPVQNQLETPNHLILYIDLYISRSFYSGFHI